MSTMPTSTLSDQGERDNFVQVQAKNISVIAPAGVGKTTAIVARIVHLAKQPDACERLPRLVVVTYSVKAAQQMQQKARVAIRDAGLSAPVQRAFQQAFFGTIHSYCVRLLERFGHYLGLPSPVGLVQEDTELWHRFLLRGLKPEIVADENLRELFHFFPPDKLYALGKQVVPGPEEPVAAFPALNLKPLLDYNGSDVKTRTREVIVRAQNGARAWSESWADGNRHRPLPNRETSEVAVVFNALWAEAFDPLHRWLRETSLVFGRRVSNAYADFRLSEAMMTYSDQVRLALQVLNFPAVQAELASEKVSVLLDEAQDTDPQQFQVLQKVAGLGAAAGQAADQTFCIVGDFQQAIYAPRSDLGMYRSVHARVIAEPHGLESRLQVTFRCDAAVIAFVNTIFPSVLDGANNQSQFVELKARHEAGPGQVIRWPCPDEPDHAQGEKISADDRAEHEAKFVAKRVQEIGCAGLSARAWSQVAILCPRIDWLVALHRELDALDLPVQFHSSREQRRDSMTVAWLTSLVWIAAHPEDTFEIAGVLREILGVPDSDMAHFTHYDGDKLALVGAAPSGEGTVAQGLRLLREACTGVGSLPLHEAVTQLVEKTQLRARLESIEEVRLEFPGRELDNLLAVIAGRSAAGVTLAALAEELRSGLTQASETEEEISDAIQLLTSYKSKGLEWDAVIVPFVFRAIGFRSESYPRVVQIGEGREIVCRDKIDFDGHANPWVNTRERQQFQRLLYVTATRARRTLIWIDDEVLYTDAGKKISPWSSAHLLGFYAENRPVWLGLPEVMSLPAIEPAAKPVAEKSVPVFDSLPGISRDMIKQAVARAGDFPRRTTPHKLAIHAPHEAEPEARSEQKDDAPAADNPGILYGTWWHEFIETLPWHKPMAAWQQKFVEAQPRSPQKERSAREWELFQKSKLAKWLAEPGRVIQVELPFLAPSGGTCLEGVMDLAVYSEKEKTWSVIDWKTNHVGPAGGQGLAAIYRGQINAYVDALKKMLSAEVRGSLYLTQTGEWVDIER